MIRAKNVSTLLDSAKNALDARVGTVILLREGMELLLLVSGMDDVDESQIDFNTFEQQHSIIGQILRTGKHFRLSNSDALDMSNVPANHLKLRGFLGVPILDGAENVIGCLTFNDKIYGMDFDENDERIAVSLATHGAIALENARLYEEISNLVDELEIKVKERTKELEETQGAILNILEDSTESNLKLEAANDKLEELNRVKSDFLGTISHELRTPLTSIIGYSSLLLQNDVGNDLSSEQKEYATGISENGKHLLTLITEMLDFAKLEFGEMLFDVEHFSAKGVISDAVSAIKHAANMKHHEIVVDIEPGVKQVCADKIKTKQVLLNLLHNAVKFTPDGGNIVVKAENFNEMVKISVIDNGVGINENIDKIFDKFVQVDQSISRKYGGTGLGLAIVKQFVESMGGEVSVESEFGVGSTLSITLPVGDTGGKNK